MTALANVTAVVLAAGLSSRHGGGNKLLRDVDGKPLAAHIADTLAAMDFRDRIAVVADGRSEIADIFTKRRFSLTLNPEPARGQGHSLALGVQAAVEKNNPEAVLICLADMPFISAGVVQKLVAALDDKTGASICLADNHLSPPAAFHRRYFDVLVGLDGDTGARKVLSTLTDVAKVDVAPSVLADFDSEQDFT